ncbi:multidrug resistance protein 1 [Dacryopinax primogenitus]|uniref:Multidrug resistance protein 1 n=1 Tax=Dacryopinax primogenitus (strain DJM 731) TaxID=1858805 RepID=M5FSF3_DACPD|nr:multidrug resistance protein 1 [Dacryopinax primogenitus]EJT98109.1 multidrug resistance protein 1 [Dacryopinax primogenitus]
MEQTNATPKEAPVEAAIDPPQVSTIDVDSSVIGATSAPITMDQPPSVVQGSKDDMVKDARDLSTVTIQSDSMVEAAQTVPVNIKDASARVHDDSGDAISEKGPPAGEPEKGHGLFRRRKQKPVKEDILAKEEATAIKSVVDESGGPVSFTSVFRFSTRRELFLNFIGLLCACAAGSAQPLMSLMFGKLTQGFVVLGAALQGGGTPDFSSIAGDFLTTARQDAMYIAIIAGGMYVTTHIYMLIWTYTGDLAAKRVPYLQTVLRHDIAFFDTLGAGEVATRIQANTQLIQSGIGEKVPIIMTYLSGFVAGYIIAYIRSWRLALALTSILPCISISVTIVAYFVGKALKTNQDAIAASGSLAEEVISTIRTTKAFGIQDTLSKLYKMHVDIAYHAQMTNMISQSILMWVFFFVLWSAYALAFYYGTTLVLDGIGDVGVIVNVFMAIVLGSFSLAQMAPEMQSLAAARTAASKIWATIDRVPSIDSLSPAGLKPATCEGRITFENVRFRYSSRPEVEILKGISIDFEPGKTAALVGASGSGKSTIVSLVERFYDPIEGSVKVDGVDVKDLNIQWLRTRSGSSHRILHTASLVPPYEHASPDEKFVLIKDAAIEANADNFIRSLPDGYDTNVGQAGLLMSGGQKQRIAIARAIVSNPRILLLDEATSALDTQSEGVVQQALDKASRGRTTITIAHRLTTIKDADQIYVMDQGTVIEHGTHDELVAHDGPYHRLVNAQKLREESHPETAEVPLVGVETRSDGTDDAESVVSVKPEIEIRPASGLARVLTSRSVASVNTNKDVEPLVDQDYSMLYLFYRMSKLCKESLPYYALGSCAAMATGMVYPVFGIVYGGAIEGFQSTGQDLRNAGNHNALLFFIIAIVASVWLMFQSLFFGKAAALLTSKIRNSSFTALLRQDAAWYDEERHSTGVLTSNLSENPQKVNGLGGATLGAIIQSLTTLIGGAIVALCFGWKIALVGIACIPLTLMAGIVRLQVVVLKDKRNVLAYEQSSKLACEVAGAIRTVASLKREQTACAEYSKSLEEPLRHSQRTAIYSTGLYAFSQAASFGTIALLFWYGSGLLTNEGYSVKNFFITMMSVVFGSMTAGNVFALLPDISLAKRGAASTVALLDSDPIITSASGAQKVPEDLKGQLEFREVHFRYPTRPKIPVLRGVNLTIKPGESVAICGASGCGKSTMIQLFERFYDPLFGDVTIDGISLRKLDLADYRKHIAIVSQEPTLYAGSIRFNILLGATKPPEEVTQAELDKVCQDANIFDFIQSLPHGFETQVGNKGTALSGGQKQRIAIARALIRDPKVLLLDEATSALDSQSERVVQEALDKASRGRTTIAIAHRLSTIQNCDRIYFMREGLVAEQGTHDELLEIRGGYYDMVQLQGFNHRA